MSKSNFGGKKAAPFSKGGGRKQNSPKTHKGTQRKKASGQGSKGRGKRNA